MSKKAKAIAVTSTVLLCGVAVTAYVFGRKHGYKRGVSVGFNEGIESLCCELRHWRYDSTENNEIYEKAQNSYREWVTEKENF
jgi:hypothetical protein